MHVIDSEAPVMCTEVAVKMKLNEVLTQHVRCESVLKVPHIFLQRTPQSSCIT